MPYYISNEMSDCAGWATIKADSPDATPETIGCHQTKQDAIDQMVAVSLSEDMEPMGDWATRSLLTDAELVTDDELNEQYEMNQAEPSMELDALKRTYEAVKSILDEITEKIGELQVEPTEELIEVEDEEEDVIDETFLRMKKLAGI